MVSNAKRQTLVIAPSLTSEGIALTVIALTLTPLRGIPM